MIRLLLILFSIFSPLSLEGSVPIYKKYPFDSSALEKYGEAWLTYKNIYRLARIEKRELSFAEREKAIATLKTIYDKEKEWVEIYWLYAGEMFQLAALIDDESQLDKAKKWFEKSKVVSRECLELEKNHSICKFLLGSSIGKIGTIDGVFSSMSNGKEVYELWTDVINSEYNHMLTDRISMQSTVRFAMGIFLRLVPDWIVLKWLFGVKGDLDRSVEVLEESMKIDGPFPCGRLMLASSLLCRADGDEKSEDYRRGIQELELIPAMDPHTVQSDICKKDSIIMLKDPSLACGYSTARQQEKASKDQL